MVGPGKENALSDSAYRAAIDYIRAHNDIWEVILTGGDPLMLSPRRMSEIMAFDIAFDEARICQREIVENGERDRDRLIA